MFKPDRIIENGENDESIVYVESSTPYYPADGLKGLEFIGGFDSIDGEVDPKF